MAKTVFDPVTEETGDRIIFRPENIGKILAGNPKERISTGVTAKIPSDLSPLGKKLVGYEITLADRDKKTRGPIYNSLYQIDLNCLVEILRLVQRRVIHPQGELSNCLLQSFVNHGKATQLFQLLCRAAFEEAHDDKEGDQFVINILHWLGKNEAFSSSLIKSAMKDEALKTSIVYLIFYCLKRGLEIRTAEAGTYYFPWLIEDVGESGRYFAWPLNPTHRQWVDSLFPPIQAQWQAECELLKRIWDLKADWPSLDQLWKKIRTEAIYGLHADGDTIEFRLEELRLYRIENCVLKKGAIFPEAEVVINTDTLGTKQQLTGKLVNGRLDFAEFYWREYAQWFITLAILSGYYQIVTGEEPDDEPWYAKLGKKHPDEKLERRPAKPHFFTLWDKRKASPQARQACLETFGRELAPGKTFRMGKKMVAYTKKKISAVVTRESLSRHAAQVKDQV